MSERFIEETYKLTRYDQKYKKKLSKVLKILEKDINHPSLRLHKLAGTSNYSISVSMSIRIIMTIDNNLILLLRIGKHEEVY